MGKSRDLTKTLRDLTSTYPKTLTGLDWDPPRIWLVKSWEGLGQSRSSPGWVPV